MITSVRLSSWASSGPDRRRRLHGTLLYPPPRRRAFNSRPFAPQTSLVHCCVYRFARAMHRKSDELEQTEVAWFENDSQKTALELYFLIVTCELAHNEELI